MAGLRSLVLRGASSVRDLSPLAGLGQVTQLRIESLRHVRDLGPIAAMRGVIDLELGGDWHSPRNAHVDSIAFLREMPQLEVLVLHTIIVDDRDYTPILTLPALRSVRVKGTRGMRPSYEELLAATPRGA